MIKEIANEYDTNYRKNILQLLDNIKDFDYTVYNNLYLVHNNDGSDMEIYIGFNEYTHRINMITIKNIYSRVYLVDITHVPSMKGEKEISEKLYNKYIKKQSNGKEK